MGIEALDYIHIHCTSTSTSVPFNTHDCDICYFYMWTEDFPVQGSHCNFVIIALHLHNSIVNAEIQRQRLQWLGHVKQMDNSGLPDCIGVR